MGRRLAAAPNPGVRRSCVANRRRVLGSAAAIVVPSLIVLAGWFVFGRNREPGWTGPPVVFPTGGPVSKPSAAPSAAPPSSVSSVEAAAALERAQKRQREEAERQLRARHAATAAALLALRDAPDAGALDCGRFAAVSMAAAAKRRRAATVEYVDECVQKKDVVRCVEFEKGFFVPVDSGEPGCQYQLWHVPKPEHGSAPAPMGPEYREFDIEFTVRIFADDVDRDGVTDAVMVRGYEHPEGVSSSTSTSLLEISGEVTDLPFDDMRDQDLDGRADGILSIEVDVSPAALCDPPDAGFEWKVPDLVEIVIVAHRTAEGTFSLTDAASRKARDFCDGRYQEPLIATDALGVTDQGETAMRLVCRLANGEDAEKLRKEVAAACSTEFTRADCRTRRPRVCTPAFDLGYPTESLAKLPGWLLGR